MSYWVVGATWGGLEDVLPQFIKRGYWYCWDVNEFENEEGGVRTTQGRSGKGSS